MYYSPKRNFILKECLLPLAGAATSNIFLVTKLLSWQTCDKRCLFLQQKYARHGQTLVECLSQQMCVCRDKLTFVVTNTCLLWQNMSFVKTKVCLSQQNFSRDKHTFVATSICHDKSFVATKIMLVAAPVNGSGSLQWVLCVSQSLYSISCTAFCTLWVQTWCSD